MVLAMGLVMAVTVGRAEAQVEMPFSSTFSGTAISTQIDTNGDGVTATEATLIFNGTLGQYTGKSLAENSVPVADPVNCPAGNLEFALVVQRTVGTFPNGDLLLGDLLNRTFCLDPLTGAFSGNGEGVFIGGTGQFAGATGSFELSFAGQVLVLDPATNQIFNFFTGESTGTLILPGELTDLLDCNGDGVVNGLDLLGIGCP